MPRQHADYLQQVVSQLSAAEPLAGDPIPETTDYSMVEPEQSPRFNSEKSLIINDEEIFFKHAVLACGASPVSPSEFPKAVTPLEILSSPVIASRCLVVGGGPLGISTAGKLAEKKTYVELLARHGRVLPNEDPALSSFAANRLEQAGVRIVSGLQPGETSVNCAGLRANTEDLNLKAARIFAAAAGVKTDEQMLTSNPNVYAAGAVTGPPFSIALERFQAELVIENMSAPFFMKHRMLPEAIPLAIPFSTPLARIGLTEPEAVAKYKDALTVTQPITGGFLKLIARKRSALVAGVHIAGVGADSLIMYFGLLMRAEIALREVTERHHYPTGLLPSAAAEAINRWVEVAGR
jgi:dihydrolipoamide dehydrogenase